MQTLPKSPKRASPAIPAWLLLAFLVAGFQALPAVAATNTTTHTNAPTDGSEHRCLFILDTSRAMQRRSEAAVQTIGDLIYSGLYGQLRTGDTVGFWTVNDKLHAGEFPVQGYVAEKRRATALTVRVTTFLQKQKYENTANLAVIMPKLDPIMKNSRLLTVVIVSDGLTKMSGTPFDEKINEMYATWAPEQQKARKPIITMLRSYKGKWVNFTVTPSQWKLELPALPVEPRPDQLATPKGTNKPVILPPLIVSGKKPEPQPIPQTSSAPAVSLTNPVVKSSNVTSSTSPATTTSAPPPVAQPGTKVPGNTLAPRTAPSPAPTNTVQTTLTNSSPPKPAVETPTVSPAPTTPPSNTVAQAPTASKTNLPPAPTATAEPKKVVPATQATAVPARSNKLVLIGGGGALLLLLLLGAVILLARPKRPQHISLITRSLDRENNPRK